MITGIHVIFYVGRKPTVSIRRYNRVYRDYNPSPHSLTRLCTAVNRQAFAEALARVLAPFFAAHYDIDLAPAGATGPGPRF